MMPLVHTWQCTPTHQFTLPHSNLIRCGPKLRGSNLYLQIRCVGQHAGVRLGQCRLRSPLLLSQTTFRPRSPRQDLLLWFAYTKPPTKDPWMSLHLSGLLHQGLNSNTDNSGVRRWDGIAQIRNTEVGQDICYYWLIIKMTEALF